MSLHRVARLSYFHGKSIFRHLPAYTRAISTDPSSIIESVRSKLKNQDSKLEKKQINLLSSVLCGRIQNTDDLTGKDVFELATSTFEALRQTNEDLALATELFKKAHELDNTDASYTYAQLLRLGQGCTPDPVTAAKIFTDLSLKAHPYAQFSLGVMYYSGLGIEQSHSKAFTLYKVSAKNGIPQAYSALGDMYFNGQGIPEDKEEAVKCYENAAKLGDPAAHLSLAQCYNKGSGVEASFQKSFDHYKAAADAELVLGIYNVAVHYFAGKGVEHSFEKAIEYFQKAADRGFTAAQVNLGNMYYQGLGVEKNVAKAKELYSLAAEDDKNAKKLLEELELEEQENKIETN